MLPAHGDVGRSAASAGLPMRRPAFCINCWIIPYWLSLRPCLTLALLLCAWPSS